MKFTAEHDALRRVAKQFIEKEINAAGESLMQKYLKYCGCCTHVLPPLSAS